MTVRTERGQSPTGERSVLRSVVGSGLVGSKSEPGAWHVVEGYRCDCKSFEYRNKCAHLLALIDAEIRAGVRGELPPTPTVIVVVVAEQPAAQTCRECERPAVGGGYCQRHKFL